MLTYQEKASFLAGNQSAKHFANLKSGAITPLTKGGFTHLLKIGETLCSSCIEDLLGVTTRGNKDFIEVTTRGRIEFLEPIKKGSYLATRFCQFFGSMPRLSSSLRRSRLIQPALLSSPSSIMALVKRSDKSASKRSCTTILSFWFSLVDIGVHPYILNLLNGNVHHCIPLSKAMPRSGGTLTGHLITTDSLFIEVTMSKHNTPVTGRTSLTPNQSYRWLFLALNRSDYTAKPCRIAVTAPNENSARLMLVRDYILSFAGRLPAQEVAHA
ncbi:host cell division inhibitor Icd-like protein [Providencia rettgeri]